MAGAGYKLFATGDVLTAAQVNTYLMQQTVMVFASSAARTSAISGVLAEGMVSYLQDSNTLEVYDGAAWVGATGDITGLTAGTGISISSATGPVPTVTNSMATEITAKGDLIVGTGSGTFDNLAVSSQNGDTIVADSSTATGLKWTKPKIVQIIHASTTTQVAVTTNTPTDTTLTATITPTSASNKILIFVNQNGVLKEAANTSAVIDLLRGGSQIARFANYAGLTVTSVVNGVGTGGAGSYLDEPATTSATTYKTQFYSEANINGVIVQHGGIMSTITLMEVTP